MNRPTTPFRGGRVFSDDDAQQPEQPSKRVRYTCFAEQCPMPGTIFPGVTQGSTTDRAGVCAWHYGVLPSDVPKVTRVLRDWDCVSFEIREARRVLTGELASDAKALGDAFAKAWERLQPLVVGEWEDVLKPGHIRNRKGVEQPYAEGYADWAKRLQEFIGARVLEVLSTRSRRHA